MWSRKGTPVLMVFAAGSALAPHSVQAAALFKCRGADGVPSYQSAPCAEPAQQLWQREVTPEPEPRATPQRTQSQQPARVRTRVVRQIGRAHVRTPVTNAHLVCRLLLEKKKRKTILQRPQESQRQK